MNKAAVIGLWIVTVLLGVMMAGSGFEKLRHEKWVELFAGWGYPDNFVYVVGVVELLGGLALLVPRTATYAGLALAAVMIGATTTQIGDGAGTGTIGFHIVLILLYLLVAFVRRPAFLRPAAPERAE